MTISDGVYEDYIAGKNSFAKKFSPNIFTEEGDKMETNSCEDFFEKKQNKEELWWSFAINGVILAIILLVIIVFNIRELEPYVEQIQSAPHHTVYLKERVDFYCVPLGLCHNFGQLSFLTLKSAR
jgi:hypothetical protein